METRSAEPTELLWPPSVCKHAPLLASQILTVLSPDAEASRVESWEKATDETQSLWPSNVCSRIRNKYDPSRLLDVGTSNQATAKSLAPSAARQWALANLAPLGELKIAAVSRYKLTMIDTDASNDSGAEDVDDIRRIGDHAQPH